ncbi:hypothetical protein [Xanthocytophaga agilis]|uniref:Uncharacterized protein n=1 Tax=Xanthocytophaga agilis TaxID=3048010 RepID=A0AAE3UC06_9BACT|nr:hypothetical protein [Xanthocytophaga agilis]MDJ1499605.1 hypothetical protein [Xanthocytophaga agilis]
MLKIVTRDLQSFQNLMMDQMDGQGEIGKMKSMLVLSVLKDSKKLPIPE